MIKKSELIIIDIEASSLGTNSYPIEVGLFGYNLSYSNLIIPEKEWVDWSQESEKIHNLDRNYLFEHGVSIKKIADDLNVLLHNKTIYSDAVSWDSFWIDKLFFKSGRYRNFDMKSVYNLSKNKKEDFLKNRGFLFEEEQKKGNEKHRVGVDTKVIHKAAIKSFF